MSVSRRNFLRGGATTAAVVALGSTVSVGAASPSSSLAGSHNPGVKTSDSGVHITFSTGAEIDLVLDSGRLRGIGAVSINGKTLRNVTEVIWPEIATPYGRELAYIEYIGCEKRDNQLVVSTRPYFRIGHRMEWTEQAVHLLINMSSWSAPPISPDGSLLEWIFDEATEICDGVEYRGFSYAFHYRSPGLPIFQIEDKATWELGGDIVGNGFIMRGANNPHTRFRADTTLYSGWDLAGAPNPHIFQHKPLYTQLQGFTFQYDASHALITVHEHPSHVRSVFLRRANEPTLLHFNQFCFDFTDDHTTPARKILLAERRGAGDTAIANQYLSIRDQIQEQHRKYYGLKYDKTRPVSHLESGGLAPMEKFPAAFEQLKEWSIHRAFIMPIWRSPDTDINPLFEKEKERFGVFGNLCCPLELEIADCYGGWQGFERLMAQAAANGIEPYIWHASHFSSITPLTDRIPDLLCRDLAGQYNHNNYGHVLFAVNQRSDRYQKYLIDCYTKAAQLGLKGLFHDSHFNLATDTINYLHGSYQSQNAPAESRAFRYPDETRHNDQIFSMHDTALSLQQRLQSEVGLFYYVESEGSLGTSMTSPDYEFLRGNEFIYSNMDSAIDLRDLEKAGDDPTMVYFRGLSVRLTYQVSIDPRRFPAPESIANWWRPSTMVPLNRAFERVEAEMERMSLLENGNGVIWRSLRADVIFAYKDFVYPLAAGATAIDAIANFEITQKEHLSAQQLGIYLIRHA